VNYSGANSRSWRVLESLFPGAPDTVRCTPDSPVNYSGAPLDFSKVKSSALSPLVHRTQSGGTQPDQGTLRLSLALFVEPNYWSFYWLNVNLWHLYNLCTRANYLVQLFVLDNSTTKINWELGVSLIPFHRPWAFGVAYKYCQQLAFESNIT
jgi:hypothetical protein